MSSTGIKQNHNDMGYYVPVGDLRTTIFSYNATAGQTTFSVATWAFGGGGTSSFSTLVSGAGAGILKDMGKTVVSSLRTFRKVQLVVPASYTNAGLSTFGVAGRVATTPNEDYLTGYIELGFEGQGTPAKVAHFGR